jgi:hypothetical protein
MPEQDEIALEGAIDGFTPDFLFSIISFPVTLVHPTP